MQAGTLRHRVEIQVPVEARDDIGGVTQTWQVVGQAWAHIEPLQGREVFEAQSLEARLSHRITLRGYFTLDTRWRLVWQGRPFQLYSLRNLDERQRTIVALAMEVLN